MAFVLPASEAAKLDAIRPVVVGQGMAAAAVARSDWLPEDTENWMTDYPLPATFIWNGERAYPRYRLKKGYGQWLRTSGQYYPALRGLFRLCHEILASCEIMPTRDQLAALVDRQNGRAEPLPMFPEDMATPAAVNPAEDAPGSAAAPQPTQTQRTPSGNPDDCPF